MKYISLDIRFEGSEFYPSRLVERTKLPIKILAEYGKVSLKGRYKGQPSPYGIGLIEMQETDKQKNIPDLIQSYSAKLLENKDHLKECGVDNIIFDIESSKSHADISLSHDILKNLSALNAKVEFHTLNDNDDAEETEEMNIIEWLNAKTPNSNRAKAILDKLYSSHPSITKASLSSYLLYLYMEKAKDSNELDKDLNNFDNFYKELAERWHSH